MYLAGARVFNNVVAYLEPVFSLRYLFFSLFCVLLFKSSAKFEKKASTVIINIYMPLLNVLFWNITLNCVNVGTRQFLQQKYDHFKHLSNTFYSLRPPFFELGLVAVLSVIFFALMFLLLAIFYAFFTTMLLLSLHNGRFAQNI